jgi:hypothetical protein
MTAYLYSRIGDESISDFMEVLHLLNTVTKTQTEFEYDGVRYRLTFKHKLSGVKSTSDRSYQIVVDKFSMETGKWERLAEPIQKMRYAVGMNAPSYEYYLPMIVPSWWSSNQPITDLLVSQVAALKLLLKTVEGYIITMSSRDKYDHQFLRSLSGKIGRITADLEKYHGG